MIKKTTIVITTAILLLTSCNNDDSVAPVPTGPILTPKEMLLTRKPWRKIRTASYIEDGSDSIVLVISNSVKVSFFEDHTLSYYDDYITGRWRLIENEQYLTSDAHTGGQGGTIYPLFPHERIEKLTEEDMTLVADTLIHHYYSPEGGGIYKGWVKSYYTNRD